MPTPNAGRESRRSSKSGASGSDAYHSSERREKAKSSQSYTTAQSASRRGSVQPQGSDLGSVPERPGLKSRTRSAPLVEYRKAPPAHPDTAEDRADGHEGQAGGGALADGRDEDEVAGVVGAVRQYQPFQSPEVLHTSQLPLSLELTTPSFQISEPLIEINIAVIGAEGVGKSTFVQRVLDLPYLPPSQATERKIPVDGNVYLVRLLELPIDDLDIDDEDPVTWPDTIEDKVMPRVDGALTLYNVKDRSSLENIPEMLSEWSSHDRRSNL